MGFKAIRIGCLLLLLPILFVLQPALILKGPLVEIIQVSATAITAVILLAASFEGYLYQIGRLAVPGRVLMGAAGLLLLIPETKTDLIGLAIGVLGIGVSLWTRDRTQSAGSS